MNNSELLNRYIEQMNADPSFAKSTKASYLSDVRYYIRFLGPQSVLSATPDTITQLIRHMVSDGRSSSGIHRTVVSVRNFYKYLIIQGLVSANPAKDFTVQKINQLIS